MGEHKHYKESGKFSPVGAVLMVLATAVCGGLLFWLYLLFEGWCTIIYLNVFAAVAGSFALGFVGGKIVKTFKMRNTVVAVACAVVGFLLATYFKWALYDYNDLKKYGYELMEEYKFEAVFIGSGAGLPRFMGIEGESLKGVYSANEFLTRTNLMKAYKEGSATPIMNAKKVAVVGGGNVAMDAARCAQRLGAESVYIVYRRSMDELPARKEEVEHAEEEGIIFKTLNNPVEILGDEHKFVKGMKCVEMELGEPDASGRRRPIVKEGSEFVLDVDCVIMSIGTSPNPLIKSTTANLETNKHGCIVTDGEKGQTSREGVFAGGDAVTGAATVISAMGAGKASAKAIDEYIKSKN